MAQRVNTRFLIILTAALAALIVVAVASVVVIKMRKGKAKRTRFGEVKKKDRKRAIVKLAGDDRIELF